MVRQFRQVSRAFRVELASPSKDPLRLVGHCAPLGTKRNSSCRLKKRGLISHNTRMGVRVECVAAREVSQVRPYSQRLRYLPRFGRWGAVHESRPLGGKQAAPVMSFPLFLFGLLVTLLVVATSSYIISGSIWTTFSQTVICLVLAQVGYFASVLFLVWWSGRTQRRNATSKAKSR